ncbi:RNase adapter RapZ [Athalassotoga saccharophila]|uniref:RNase adapter RapZ n=1 Tax=Athalassotoga saccharophila TaxID=1441386 RepID=UPI0013797844|nr:RNase adapter RapZ [Athalassotoga saccharophila]BBJ28138.1 nucleotide-binding protein YvcJ [Athalassotoga saccharophila]
MASEFVLISGMSGAGKTTALGALEDAGYFCMDNVPPSLIVDMLSLMESSFNGKKIAAIVDVRAGKMLGEIKNVIENLRSRGITIKIIFLDAKDDVLINRYNLTRRRHPLAEKEDQQIEKLLKQERELLREIREIADYVVDTSLISTHQLRSEIIALTEGKYERVLKIFLESFGFKYGLPLGADFIFDARFLPNPYYVESLSAKTGNDPEVIEYLEKFDVVREYAEKIIEIVKMAIKNYSKEGKSVIYVGIGCSGGRHRSVYLVNQIAKELEKEVDIRISHRDIER